MIDELPERRDRRQRDVVERLPRPVPDALHDTRQAAAGDLAVVVQLAQGGADVVDINIGLGIADRGLD